MNEIHILIALVGIAFVSSLAVEVEKKLFLNFPNNILAVATASIITILAFVAYINYCSIRVETYMVIGIVALCIAESYISMFGYDKFRQTVLQYKSYARKDEDK